MKKMAIKLSEMKLFAFLRSLCLKHTLLYLTATILLAVTWFATMGYIIVPFYVTVLLGVLLIILQTGTNITFILDLTDDDDDEDMVSPVAETTEQEAQPIPAPLPVLAQTIVYESFKTVFTNAD